MSFLRSEYHFHRDRRVRKKNSYRRSARVDLKTTDSTTSRVKKMLLYRDHGRTLKRCDVVVRDTTVVPRKTRGPFEKHNIVRIDFCLHVLKYVTVPNTARIALQVLDF